MAQEITKPDSGKTPAEHPLDMFSSMRREFDRVFDTFLGRGPSPLQGLTRRGDTLSMMPSIDVRETSDAFLIEAELPGLDEKDVTITMADGVLTLKGEKKSEREETEGDYHLSERSYGSFQRAFRLADSIDPDKVKARFDKGVLAITLPKRPEAEHAVKRVPIGKP